MCVFFWSAMKGGLVDIDSLSGLLRGAAVSSSSSVEAERLPPPMAPPAISTEPEEAPASADDEGGEVELGVDLRRAVKPKKMHEIVRLSELSDRVASEAGSVRAHTSDQRLRLSPAPRAVACVRAQRPPES